MTSTPQKERTPQEQFVAFLRGLAERQDRGALAQLRRSLGRPPDAEMLRLVVPYLPQDRRWEHRWYFVTASLFGLYPDPGGKGNLGDTFRQLGDHESAQKRFIALLDSHSEDLPHRLRQAVSLAKSSGAPIDWYRLLEDLLHWDTENRVVQQRWARAYWGHREPPQGVQGQVEAAAADSEKGA